MVQLKIPTETLAWSSTVGSSAWSAWQSCEICPPLISPPHPHRWWMYVRFAQLLEEKKCSIQSRSWTSGDRGHGELQTCCTENIQWVLTRLQDQWFYVVACGDSSNRHFVAGITLTHFSVQLHIRILWLAGAEWSWHHPWHPNIYPFQGIVSYDTHIQTEH